MIVLFPGHIIMKNLYMLSYMNPKTFFKKCIEALDPISRFQSCWDIFPFPGLNQYLEEDKGICSMTKHIASGASRTSNPLILYLTLTLSHCCLVFKCVCL